MTLTAMLFLGTVFVPAKDRDATGSGFTHREGDVVRVSSPKFGSLMNSVTTFDRAPPWTFGARELLRFLQS